MAYFVGLDLATAVDFTAIAVLHRGDGPKPAYLLQHLQRVRGVPYLGTVTAPGIVENVRARLLAEPALRGCHLAVDRTGVGRPVVDAFRAAGLPCVLWALTITAGASMHQEQLDLSVPKRDLVGAAQMLLGAGRLHFDSRLPLADTLRQELKNFAVKITAAGNEQFAAWRENATDDCVFAVAMACWLGERFGSADPRNILSGGGIKGTYPRGTFATDTPDMRRLSRDW